MDFLYIKKFHIITLIIVIIFLTSGCLLSTDSNFKGVSFEESDLNSNKYFSDTNQFEDDSDEDYIETTHDSAPSAYPPIASDDDLFSEIEMPNRSLILDNLRPTPTIIPKAVITKTPTPTPLPTKTPSPALIPKATPTPSPTKAPVYNNTIVFENLMGKSGSYVNEQFGKPAAVEKSEYGFYWHIYHKNYSGFIMIGIRNNIVVGLYSNSSTFRFENLKVGSAKSLARTILCEDYTGPVTFIDKGSIRYKLSNTDQKDVFIYDKLPSLKNSSKYYVTVFYDNIEGGTITSVQVIDYLTEQSFGYMPEPDNEVVKSYEKISFYLVNSIRVRFKLPLLIYDNNMATIAKAHSQDMIDRDYFSHTSLPIDPEDSEDEGKKYTDRIKEAGYLYLRCAENLSTGHPNAIYSHESLMNSVGHRENIFCNVTNIGIGVAITQGEVRMTQIYIKYQ